LHWRWKSSIIIALFHLAELSAGSTTIESYNIADMQLEMNTFLPQLLRAVP
jgi:hypothetical protein